MAKVVKADAGQTQALDAAVKALRHAVGANRRAVGGGEHQPGVAT